ncbi:uncharacterized protein B0H18DRAFT_1050018, partial [Fomitopsis serialis]|uniref:uncharacterized protein n=1 Tax=Fomitopsis serialis TaxID=139415 RepID=UPI0020084004
MPRASIRLLAWALGAGTARRDRGRTCGIRAFMLVFSARPAPFPLLSLPAFLPFLLLHLSRGVLGGLSSVVARRWACTRVVHVRSRAALLRVARAAGAEETSPDTREEVRGSSGGPRVAF